MTPWHEKNAHDIRDAVSNRDVSAVEVTRSYLDRIDAVDSKVQAFTQIWRNEALAQAEAVDKKAAAGQPLRSAYLAPHSNF